MKKAKDLILTSKKELWTIDSIHGTKKTNDARMLKVIDEVFKRDRNTCQYCGWRSREHQEVHHLDHNHNNFNLNNLVTCCPLCHQVFHLPSIGTRKSGILIWMPEIPQAMLNNLSINLFLGMKDERLNEISTSFYSELEKRKDVLLSIGKNHEAYDPSVLAEILILLEKENNIDALKEINKNIRILPTQHSFKTQIDYWVKERQILKNNNFYNNFEDKVYKHMFEDFFNKK